MTTVPNDTLASLRANEKMAGKLEWYFLTFTEANEHLGATIIEAYGMADAALTAAEKSIDPGRGRVVVTTVHESQLPEEKFRNRLLTKAEVASFWPEEPQPKET
jgi:hypothetical protein